MSYVPLSVHSHYSLQLGLSKPKDIAKRCISLGIVSCAITDLATISGTISFYKEMISNKIKPILGCELYILDNENMSKITVLCRNLDGWKDLIKIISKSNNIESYKGTPCITCTDLSSIITSNSLICIDGFYASSLWNKITQNNIIVDDYEKIFHDHINLLNDTFGIDNVFISIQLLDDLYNKPEISNIIRDLCKKYKVKRIAGIDSYYATEQDSDDQKILICSNLKSTLPELSKKVLSNINTGFNHFFLSNKYHIPSYAELANIYDKDEIDNTNLIDSMCESFSPLSKPILPRFDYPKNFNNESEYLRQLCREGWKKKIEKTVPKQDIDTYVQRIKYELEILDGAGLSSYFLIVRDILQYVRGNGWLPGPGRGSAAGCLVSYLIDITNIDPIKYNLLFERFYNAGRNTKDRISMPDIDVDVPITQRDNIIRYIKDKYGHDKVSQMITFNTLKGRGALKEVFRVYDNLSFEEMNNITKHIPDEAKIADELQEIKEEDGNASIILWALENNADKFKEWCEIDETGQLTGPLAKRFEQAIRIEGTKYNQSKHAAGIAIAAQTLSDICPMIYDTKTKQNIAGLEMNDLDSLGVIKFDILGIALLDKIMYVNSLINGE